MKCAILLFLLTISIYSIEPYPSNFDVDSLCAVENNLDAWNGKIVSFPILVDQIEHAYLGKPYIHVILKKPNPQAKGLWIVSLVMTGKQELRKGDLILCLGYISKIANDDTVAKKYCDNKFHVLGMCIINTGNKKGYYHPDACTQCEEWQNGNVPLLIKGNKDTGSN
jgi:hypothetical protein